MAQTPGIKREGSQGRDVALCRLLSNPGRHPAHCALKCCYRRWQCKLCTSGLGRMLWAVRETMALGLAESRDANGVTGTQDSVSPCLLAPSPSGSSPPTLLAPAQPVHTHVASTPFQNPSPQTESHRPGWGHVSLLKPSPGIQVARSGACTLCGGVGWATSATAIKSKGAMVLQKKGGGQAGQRHRGPRHL